MTKTASERFEKQNFAPGAVTLEKNAHTFRRGLKMQSGASLQNVYDCTSKAQQHQRKRRKKMQETLHRDHNVILHNLQCCSSTSFTTRYKLLFAKHV